MNNGEDHAWIRKGGGQDATEQMERYKEPPRQIIRLSGEEFERLQAQKPVEFGRGVPEVTRER